MGRKKPLDFEVKFPFRGPKNPQRAIFAECRGNRAEVPVGKMKGLK